HAQSIVILLLGEPLGGFALVAGLVGCAAVVLTCRERLLKESFDPTELGCKQLPCPLLVHGLSNVAAAPSACACRKKRTPDVTADASDSSLDLEIARWTRRSKSARSTGLKAW